MNDLFDSSSKKILPFFIPATFDHYCVWNAEYNGFFLSIPQGEIFYSEDFFDQRISDRTLEYFQENDLYDWKSTQWSNITDENLLKIKFTNIKWKHDSINMYGKIIPLPRLTSWYGDSGKSYTYSGIKSNPNEWNKGLLYIKEKIEKVAQVKFNSVLLNWYRNGHDYLNWHADDEKELGKNPVIASVNFGETRDFVIKRNEGNEKIIIPLKHGTLLIMSGEMQHFWQHSVPKRTKIHGSRFNLTFRVIQTE